MTQTQDTHQQATTSNHSTSDTLDLLQVDRVQKATGFLVEADSRKRTQLEIKMVASWDHGSYWKHPHCKVCAKIIEPLYVEEFEVWGATHKLTQTICDDCVSIVDDHYDCPVATKWGANCPPYYKNIIENFDKEDKGIDRPSHKSVAFWQYGRKGIYAYGSSGSGKTSSCWALYKRLETDGIVPVFINSVKLTRLMSQKAKEMAGPHSFLCNCRVLIIDDFGKEKMTAAAASMLWELIDWRYHHFKPTIYTSKFDSKKIVERFKDSSSDSLGFDICRRIAATCEPVKFR